MKHRLLIGGFILLLIIIIFSFLSGAREVGDAISGDGDGQVMQQIDVNSPAFQAGTAPLGENEAETGYLHEDGKRYFNGQVVGEPDDGMIHLEMDVEETDADVVKPTLTDLDGNQLELDPETEELLENVFQNQ